MTLHRVGFLLMQLSCFPDSHHHFGTYRQPERRQIILMTTEGIIQQNSDRTVCDASST